MGSPVIYVPPNMNHLPVFSGGKHNTDIIVQKCWRRNFWAVHRAVDGDERLLPEWKYAATQSSAISLDGNISMSFGIHLEIKLKSQERHNSCQIIVFQRT